MKRLFAIALCVAAFALPNHIEASVFTSLLDTSDGTTPDILKDDSVGHFIETTGTIGDGMLEVGDVIQGAIVFDPIGGNAVPTGATVMAIYSLEIKSIDAFAFGTKMELGAATGANALGTVLGGLGVDSSSLGGAFTGDEGFGLIESTAGTIDILDLDMSGGFSTLFDSSILSGADFSTVLTAGFDGVDDHHTVFNALADVSDISGLAPGSGNDLANFVGTYSVIDDAYGGSLVYLPLLNTNGLSGATGDIIIGNGGISNTDSDTVGKGFDFNDDGDFQINAVPEPGTMAAWALLLGVGGIAERRRRKKNAA